MILIRLSSKLSFLWSSTSCGKPSYYSDVSSSLRVFVGNGRLRFLFLIIFFFLTRFLRNARTYFHEIFRDGVYWSRKAKNNFSWDDFTSSRRYWRFYDVEGVVLLRNVLLNDSRYLYQIFTEVRQRDSGRTRNKQKIIKMTRPSFDAKQKGLAP